MRRDRSRTFFFLCSRTFLIVLWLGIPTLIIVGQLLFAIIVDVFEWLGNLSSPLPTQEDRWVSKPSRPMKVGPREGDGQDLVESQLTWGDYARGWTMANPPPSKRRPR